MTWNLGRRSHPDQARIFADADADVFTLQEVSTLRTASAKIELARVGLSHVISSKATGQGSPFSMMVASRWPVTERMPHDVDVARPDRVQVVIIHTPHGDVELVHVHVPAARSSGVATKVSTYEGLARYLATNRSTPRVLCGDLNTPKHESNGHIEYWGNARQQRAERGVIEGGEASGLRDAFRALHPSTAIGSWRASKTVTRRYDHVFASFHFEPVAAAYGDLEAIAEAGVSDHAPLRVALTSDRLGTIDEARLPSPTFTMVPAQELASAKLELPRPNVAKEGSRQLPLDESASRAFLASLSYRTDVRNPPDARKRGQFRHQWRRAARGETLEERTLMNELSWANLGYRAGREFGPASDATMDAMFARFASIYRSTAHT